MAKTNFREQIKKLIKEKGISISKLARLADLSTGTVFNYLNGISEMSAANLGKLFDVLKTHKK